MKYVSLGVGGISLEIIIWIIQSIKRDRMKPADKLVLSRIKEYFMLKISLKEWTETMDFFYNNQGTVNKHSKFFEKIAVEVVPTDLREVDVGDKQLNSYIFKLEGNDWDYEDNLEIQQDSEEWENFKKYIDDFFGEEDDEGTAVQGQGLDNDKRSKQRKSKNTKNIQKWLSSVCVENSMNKGGGSLSANQTLKKVLAD